MQVTHIENKIREDHLRWFVHVTRRPADVPIWRCDTMVNECIIRGQGI